MPNFTYTAIDTSGDRIAGQVVAADKIAALDQLVAKNLTPVNVTEGQSELPWWKRDIQLFGSAKLKPKELEQFFTALSAMIKAKTKLPDALQFCANLTKNHLMQTTLQTAINGIKDGMPLADALQSNGNLFPERLVSLIRLGEASNNMETVVSRIAIMLETEAKLRREVQQALIYPLILLGMSVFVIAILVFYLAPTLAPVFASASASPPAVIAAMLSIQRFTTTNWPVALCAIGVLGLFLYLSRPVFKELLQRLLHLFPIARRYLSQKETLRLCQTLYLMLGSGGQLNEAIKTAATTTQQNNWKAMLTKARTDIEAGQSMKSALLDNSLIDPMASAILATGEASDQLVTVLGPAIEILQMETAQTLSQAVKLLTPILTILIGLVIGAIILSTISAIMDLNNVVF